MSIRSRDTKDLLVWPTCIETERAGTHLLFYSTHVKNFNQVISRAMIGIYFEDRKYINK